MLYEVITSYGVRLHTHLCETMDEERYTVSTRGMRPLAYMETVDFVGSDVHYAHGIFFNDGELKFLADTGTGVAHCVITSYSIHYTKLYDGQSARAQETATAFRQRAAQLAARYSGRDPIDVFYQVWNRPMVTVNGAHLISRIIKLCRNNFV